MRQQLLTGSELSRICIFHLHQLWPLHRQLGHDVTCVCASVVATALL